MVRPGEGKEFVYSPVEVNATIHCAVNNTNLGWEVDDLILDSELHRLVFQSRGILHDGPVTYSDRVTTSNVTVFGNIERNNNIRICCLSVVKNELNESCTVLIIYGKVTTI